MPMLKTIVILWDAHAPALYTLPQQVTVEANNEEDLINKLSDKYGYPIFGLTFYEVQPEPEE